jgi:hypothetical protein
VESFNTRLRRASLAPRPSLSRGGRNHATVREIVCTRRTQQRFGLCRPRIRRSQTRREETSMLTRSSPARAVAARRRHASRYGLLFALALGLAACQGDATEESKVEQATSSVTSNPLHAPGAITPDPASPPDPALQHAPARVASPQTTVAACDIASSGQTVCPSGFQRLVCARGTRPNRTICTRTGELNPPTHQSFCCK